MAATDRKSVVSKASEPKAKRPKLYQVVLFNDDFTPRAFVTEILKKFFAMDDTMANHTMLSAHISGKARCGVFTKEIAETKIDGIYQAIDKTNYPLQFIAEAI